VAAKSPAAAAGLKKGDVLMKLAGHAVTNRFDVERALWDLKAGDKVDAVVQRGADKDKDSVTVSLKLTPGEGQTVAVAMPPAEVKYGDFVNAAAAVKNDAQAKDQK
jgi:predicted metalloprotease with PDZ domain